MKVLALWENVRSSAGTGQTMSAISTPTVISIVGCLPPVSFSQRPAALTARVRKWDVLQLCPLL